LLPLPAFRSNGPEWVKVTLNDAFTVRFPGQPSFQTLQQTPLYSLRTGEAVYSALCLDHRTSPHYQPITDEPSRDRFYRGFMDSVLRNFKSTLADTTHFSVGGHRGVNFRYTATAADGTPLTRHSRVVLRGDYVYFLNVVPVTSPADGSHGTGNDFLASLRAKE
jgi:hypothetical protein